jgi:hypothetical protein
MKIQLSILILVFLTSCESKVRVKEKIEGTWTLQKTVTTKRVFEKPNGSENYTFSNDGTYNRKSVGFDIILDEEGYFEVGDDSKSMKNKFLILKEKVEPNSYGDTIRQHSSFEIVTISKDSLILGYQMRLLYDSFPGKWYNRVDYYTREK